MTIMLLLSQCLAPFSFFFRRASMHFREDAATLSAVNMRVNFIVGVLGVRP